MIPMNERDRKPVRVGSWLGKSYLTGPVVTGGGGRLTVGAFGGFERCGLLLPSMEPVLKCTRIGACPIPTHVAKLSGCCIIIRSSLKNPNFKGAEST